MQKLIILQLLLVTIQMNCYGQKEKLPNIILLMADDLGYNDLSCYRNTNTSKTTYIPTSQTPFIDDLAKKGMRFTDFYAGAAVCSPSRAALLTGRNATRLGIYNFIPKGIPMHLTSDEITIAEMLKQKNYETAHFGKWHLASETKIQPTPLEQGFDYGFWTYSSAKPSHKNPVNFIENRTELGELKGYSGHLVVDKAKNWLDNRKDKDKPFYMNIWFHEPHQKVAAPDSLKVKHKINKDYYGCIENMDFAVGKLLRFLKEKKMDANTIILFTSDNGSKFEGSNDPLRGEKCFQYDGGIRVPFIAYWRGKIKEGSLSNQVGHFTDVLPTIASLVNCKTPSDRIIDGEDISSLLDGNLKKRQRKEPVFFFRYFHDPICMLRQGDIVLLGYIEKPKPRQINYIESEEALFQPLKGAQKNAQWGFQKSHMNAIPNQKPVFFEMYNVKKDIGQYHNIIKQNDKLFIAMKKRMLEKRNEMINEGGNWYDL